MVTGQVKGDYQAKDKLIDKYLRLVKSLLSEFQEVKVRHVPRAQNSKADLLSKLATTKGTSQHQTLIEATLQTLSYDQEVMAATTMTTWMTPYIQYLQNNTPEDRREVRRLKRQACFYTLLDGQLYRHGFVAPLLKCVGGDQADYIMREVHLRIYGQHGRSMPLTTKVLRARFYWPTLRKDYVNFFRCCDAYQRNANIGRTPVKALHA